MLTIRDEQVRAMRGTVQRQFEDRMVTHLGEFFSDQCEALGEAGVRDAIRYGLQQAEAHGFGREKDVVRYLNLMFTFGREFDTEPACGWSAEFLNGGSPSTGADRMERLYTRALMEQHAGHGYARGLVP